MDHLIVVPHIQVWVPRVDLPLPTQGGENFHVFSLSQNLLGVSQHLRLLLWTMAPLPGASHQGELEDGETVATSPPATMAGPAVHKCLHPASQALNLCKRAGGMEVRT